MPRFISSGGPSWEAGLRRLIDGAVAGLGLALGSIVLAAIAIVLRLSQGPPVLFFQERVGKDDCSFSLVKFRTMSDARGPDGEFLPDDERITTVGRVLRRLSLDELPELWNVLVGDMSLVGPRPLPTRYLSRYSPSERRRHTVRPGLTGWAQIHGRNQLGWDDRLAMDVWYVDHRTPALDVRILLKTVGLVLRGTGVSGHGTMTMPEFRPPNGDR
jgi:sugar transferase EpsL